MKWLNSAMEIKANGTLDSTCWERYKTLQHIPSMGGYFGSPLNKNAEYSRKESCGSHYGAL